MPKYEYDYQVTAQLSLVRKTVDRRFKSGYRESIQLASTVHLLNDRTQSTVVVDQVVKDGKDFKHLSAVVPIMIGQIERRVQ